MERLDLVGRTIAAVGRAPGGAQLRCCLEVGVPCVSAWRCWEPTAGNMRCCCWEPAASNVRALLLMGTSGRRPALRVDVPASAWRCWWCAAAWRCWERAAGDVRCCCLGRRAPGGAGRAWLHGSWRCWQPVAGDVPCCFWGRPPRLGDSRSERKLRWIGERGVVAICS
jgi:hypothetical protein